MRKCYFDYWGKCVKEKNNEVKQYHLLSYHSLDVAALAWHLLAPKTALNTDLCALLGVKPKELQQFFTAIVALHDLGKFSDSFQRLNAFSLYTDLKLDIKKPYNGCEARHDVLGYVFFDYLLEENIQRFITLDEEINSSDRKVKRTLEKLLMPLVKASLSHHGMPNEPDLQKIRSMKRHYINEQNLRDAQGFIQEFEHFLPINLPKRWFFNSKEDQKQLEQNLKQISWHFAGICVIADWLGSNQEYFPLTSEKMPLEEYWQIALANAENALSKTDLFNPFVIKPFTDVERVFEFNSATPLQKWAQNVSLSEGGHLFILEDVTGAGKTEAALTLGHRLMEQGEAQGFYFGLPSMATSNAMFERIEKHYLKMYANNAKPSLVLAHSARDIQDSFTDIVGSDTNSNFGEQLESNRGFCHHWFSDSKKKALLATVGVGTIDQALLTVLPQKHQTLRLVGLYKKVLILDEIHAFDFYMQELIKNLMVQHARQGGSVILLTATLTHALRDEFIQTWQNAIGASYQVIPTEKAFPLATLVHAQQTKSTAIESTEQACRNLPVHFLHQFEDCIKLVLEKAQIGSVVWIRNTVADAQEAYQTLVKRGLKPVLFHSRFALKDRIDIENKVLKRLGKDSKQEDRKGFVVIATQVFQESLDVDTDEMITDICPIDHKIQRAGRLHRHVKGYLRHSPVLYVYAPKWSDEPDENWLQAGFFGTQAVYQSPAIMWLTMQILRDLGGINMPVQARELIEYVYQKSSHIPSALDTKSALAQAKDRGKQNSADNLLLEWRHGYSKESSAYWNTKDDILEISTRYIEQETIEIVLCFREQNLRNTNLQLVPYAEKSELSPRHIIALSSIKVPKKDAKMLSFVADDEKAEFVKSYSMAKYKKLWVLNEDANLSYDAENGLVKKSP